MFPAWYDMLPEKIPEKIIEKTAGLISARFGFRMDSPCIFQGIRRAVAERMKILGITDPAEYLERKIGSAFYGEKEIETVFNLIAINETYFFRVPEHFKVLTSYVFPGVITSAYDRCDKRISIWSAGCASGEEPYSIAITFKETEYLENNYVLELLGTDSDANMISRALESVYRKRALNAVPAHRRFYWEQTGGKFKLRDDIRQMVKFENHNLTTMTPGDPFSRKWDIVFCRNVLIYFTKEAIDEVFERLHDCLNAPGFLFVSPWETNVCPQGLFDVVEKDGIFILEKNKAATSRRETISIDELKNSKFDLKQEAEAKTEAEEKIKAETEAESKTQNERSINQPSLRPDQSFVYKLKHSVNEAMNRRCPDEALKMIREALRSQPLNAEIIYLAGSVLSDMGNAAEAAEEMNKVINLDPKFIPAYISLGILYSSLGEIDKAVYSFKKALNIDSDCVPALFHLGRLQLSAGERENGVRSLRLAKILLERGAESTLEASLGGFSTEVLIQTCDKLIEEL